MNKDLIGLYIPMDLDTDDYKLVYAKTAFNKGVSDSSYMAGIITGLLNTGLEKEQVFNLMVHVLDKGLIKVE